MSRKRKATRIGSQFIAFELEMLVSPAWRALPDCGRRVVERLCIEHALHGGAENGNLVCTYTNFREVGLTRKPTIAFAIRAATALGFIEVTEQGGQAYGEHRRPSRYRLTFVVGRVMNDAPTHEWKRIKTAEEAVQLVERAKDVVSEKHRIRGQRGQQARQARAVLKAA